MILLKLEISPLLSSLLTALNRCYQLQNRRRILVQTLKKIHQVINYEQAN